MCFLYLYSLTNLLPEIVGSGSSHTTWRMSRWRTASAVTMHHTQCNAGCESHYERCREIMHDGSDLCLTIVVCHHYTTVHSTIMAGKLCAFITQFAGKVLAIDNWRISATFDVHQKHTFDVSRSGGCSTRNILRWELTFKGTLIKFLCFLTKRTFYHFFFVCFSIFQAMRFILHLDNQFGRTEREIAIVEFLIYYVYIFSTLCAIHHIRCSCISEKLKS